MLPPPHFSVVFLSNKKVVRSFFARKTHTQHCVTGTSHLLKTSCCLPVKQEVVRPRLLLLSRNHSYLKLHSFSLCVCLSLCQTQRFNEYHLARTICIKHHFPNLSILALWPQGKQPPRVWELWPSSSQGVSQSRIEHLCRRIATNSPCWAWSGVLWRDKLQFFSPQAIYQQHPPRFSNVLG